MTNIIDGRKMAAEVAEELQDRVQKLGAKDIQPKLVIIGINPDSRSQVYIHMKQRQANQVGVATEYMELSGKTEAECKEVLDQLAEDKSVHGIIVQLPFADWGDPQHLLDHIPPSKDVDGLSSASLELLAAGKAKLIPATPLSILEIIKRSGLKLADNLVVLVGQGKLVGYPLALILQNQHAEFLVADANTANLAELTNRANILITATGDPGSITADMVPEEGVVIDAGIMDVGGTLKGDVDFESVKDKASLITPVPGGVGPMTVAMLLANVVQAAEQTLEK